MSSRPKTSKKQLKLQWIVNSSSSTNEPITKKKSNNKKGVGRIQPPNNKPSTKSITKSKPKSKSYKSLKSKQKDLSPSKTNHSYPHIVAAQTRKKKKTVNDQHQLHQIL